MIEANTPRKRTASEMEGSEDIAARLRQIVAANAAREGFQMTHATVPSARICEVLFLRQSAKPMEASSSLAAMTSREAATAEGLKQKDSKNGMEYVKTDPDEADCAW